MLAKAYSKINGASAYLPSDRVLGQPAPVAEAQPKFVAAVGLAKIDYGLIRPIPSLEEVVVPPVTAAMSECKVLVVERSVRGWPS